MKKAPVFRDPGMGSVWAAEGLWEREDWKTGGPGYHGTGYSSLHSSSPAVTGRIVRRVKLPPNLCYHTILDRFVFATGRPV